MSWKRRLSGRAASRIGTTILIFLLLVLLIAGLLLYKVATIGAGLKAKTLCSGIFLCGLEWERIIREDLALGPLRLISADVNPEDQTVTATAFGGILRRTAVYREGLGSTLAIGCSSEMLRQQLAHPLPDPPVGQSELPWPTGDVLSQEDLPEGVDMNRLNWVLDEAMSEPGNGARRTRALIVIHDGRLLAERYAPGITWETPLIGWSMTKSVTNALVGILVGQGQLSLEGPAPVPEWKGQNEPRGAITLDHLLRMNSGLTFQEVYENPLSHVCVALFGTHDAAAYVAQRRLEASPGTKWHYSTGTSVLIARIIRDALGGDLDTYWSFPREALFFRIGMRTAVMEPDPSGTFLAGSFMYASARDWARFGMLYLQDGMWEGERILPEGWVDYSRTLTRDSDDYGAHFWLNEYDEGDSSVLEHEDVESEKMSGMVVSRKDQSVLATQYRAAGFQGQSLVICPERKTVVVRLGMTPQKGNWNWRRFLSDVLDSLPSS